MYPDFWFKVWWTLTCFRLHGLPFLFKKHECLLLALEHFKVFWKWCIWLNLILITLVFGLTLWLYVTFFLMQLW